MKTDTRPVLVWSNRLGENAKLALPRFLLTVNGQRLPSAAAYSRLAGVPVLDFREKGSGWRLSYNGAHFETPDDAAYPRIDALISLAEESCKLIARNARVAWALDGDNGGVILGAAWAKATGKGLVFGRGIPNDFALAVAVRMGVRIDYKETPFAGLALTEAAKAQILRTREEK